MTRHKHAEMIIAWANGDKIEFRPNSFDSWKESFDSWKETSAPSWDDNSEYRIKEEIYHIGQVFLDNEYQPYILTQTNPGRVCLVCLKTGNRLGEPMNVARPMHVTQDELKQMFPALYEVRLSNWETVKENLS
jgi:hypothetical protein